MPIRRLLKEVVLHAGKWGQDGESGALRSPFPTCFLCKDKVVEPEVLSHPAQILLSLQKKMADLAFKSLPWDSCSPEIELGIKIECEVQLTSFNVTSYLGCCFSLKFTTKNMPKVLFF